jgi:hypothetical protein
MSEMRPKLSLAMKSRRFYLSASILLFLSVGLMLWMSTLGVTTNLFDRWWSFLGFNLMLLVLFVRPLISERVPTSEKRILGLWVLFALWYESISFSAGALRAILYVFGFLISGLSLYYGTRLEDQRNGRP